MRRSIAVSFLIPAFAFSADLIQFESGKAALARDVNENFLRLDTAIKNRAIKSTLEATEASLQATDAALKGVQATIGQIQTGKANQTDVEKVAGAKADTSALAELARKQKADNESLTNALKSTLTSGNLAGIRDTLKLKTDTSAFNAFKRQAESALGGKQAALGFAPLNSAGGTISGDLTVSKALTVGSSVSAGGFQTGGDVSALRGRFDTVIVPGGAMGLYPGGDYGAIYGDKTGAPSKDNYSLAWRRDGLISVMRAGARYLVLRTGDEAPKYYDGSAEKDVYHEGNFPFGTTFIERGDAPADWTLLNAIGGYSIHPGNYNGPTGVYAYGDLVVMGSGEKKTQIYFSHSGDIRARTKWNESDWSAWKQWMTSAGGTITGDLRITGKLTTEPGATPADYVFEPDYKLAPLSEIEAYTKANKHLPEVPSAAEMTAQGVDVAAMNMVLLKKVEELTLHAIALQKTATEQRDLIDVQRADLLVQKARLDRLEARSPQH
ncbi:MAG: hypothetical protein IPO40_13190 [Fibrobacteres bacterium]|nr:hypothetical protein [Fibrobacterota bacterium]